MTVYQILLMWPVIRSSGITDMTALNSDTLLALEKAVLDFKRNLS